MQLSVVYKIVKYTCFISLNSHNLGKTKLVPCYLPAGLPSTGQKKTYFTVVVVILKPALDSCPDEKELNEASALETFWGC